MSDGHPEQEPTGQLTTDPLLEALRRSARPDQPDGAGSTATGRGLVPREESAEQQARPEATVDCAARLHICRAVCCRLTVQLSAAEVAAGQVQSDPERPYLLRRDEDGQCSHIDRGTLACGAYADRPRPCRQYSCANDRRIWRDFEGMVLNTEWIEANLGPNEPMLIELQPVGSARPSATG